MPGNLRRHLKIAVVLLSSAFLAWGGWYGLKEYRFQRSLDELDRAVQARDFGRSFFLLRTLTDRAPQHPLLLAEKARVYSLIRHPQAGTAWIKAIEKTPGNTEYRVAAVLAFIQLGDRANAENILKSWPETMRAGTAWHRASLAMAFAQNDAVKARMHSDALVVLEPQSLVARMNQAKLALADPGKAAEARQTLQSLASDKEIGHDAFKALLQDALARKDAGELDSLTVRLREGPAATGEDHLLALEFRERASLPVSSDLLRQAWERSYSNPQTLSRLVGWMVVTRRTGQTWDLLARFTPADPWVFPSGLALAEAAVASDRQEQALSALAEKSWPGLEYLRLFCLARLSPDSQRSSRLLERAVEDAGRRAGGLPHLVKVAEEWRWEAGMVRVLQERIRGKDVSLREMSLLMALLEQRRDTAGILATTRRQLVLMKEHPAILNNAAYFSLLRGGDADEALAWTERALILAPDKPAIQSTRAFALIRKGRPDEALVLLSTLPLDPPTALIQGLALQAKGQGLPPPLKTLLEKTSFSYPEEENLRQQLIK